MKAKNLVIKSGLNLAFILFVCSLALAEEDFKAVEAEKIPEILRTISEQSKQNFEKIHTWQGELESSRRFIDKGEQAKKTFEIMTDAVGSTPNEVAEFTSSRIIFKCDLDKGISYSKRSREEPTRYFDTTDGRDLGTKSTVSCSSQIVNNEYQISTRPVRLNMNEEIIKREAVKEKIDGDKAPCETCEGLQSAYLPTYVFDIRNQVWHLYPIIAGKIEEKGEYIFDGLTPKVEQRTVSGDLQYRVHMPLRLNSFGIKYLWRIKTFSANTGYNMISLEMITADGGKLMQQENIEYQKINDVYVPVKRMKNTYDYSRDFSLRSQEEQVFKNVRINEPIPDETFTYKNLGLKDGDTFVDKIEDKEYKYKEAKLVEIEKKDEVEKKEQTTSGDTKSTAVTGN
ncbi:MAG: hypothetical protein WC476_07990 [Phycisphaerae bacterium]|jgi:hypothetical protein